MKLDSSTEDCPDTHLLLEMKTELVLKKTNVELQLSVNRYGSDTSIVVIGKSKPLRNGNSQFWKENGVDYFSNRKAWINGQIFEKRLRDFDSCMNARPF
jgi:hypothetical protein